MHASGGKITGSHTTIIDAAKAVIDAAKKSDLVTKIALGFIKANLPTGKKSMKAGEITGGLSLKIRGVNTLQTIFIYTDNPKKVEHLLYQTFNEK